MQSFFRSVAQKLEDAEAFSSVEVVETGVIARYIDEDVDGEFWLEWTPAGLEVAMKTPDRWLSQSVEATLMNTGDELEELIDEELVELGCEEGPLPIKHFRDEQRRYVFQSPAPIEIASATTPEAVETAAACLLAFERAFAPLGDFAGGDED